RARAARRSHGRLPGVLIEARHRLIGLAAGVVLPVLARIEAVAARVLALLHAGIDDGLHARIDAVGILGRLVHIPADHPHRGISLRGRLHRQRLRGRRRHRGGARRGAALELAAGADELLDPALLRELIRPDAVLDPVREMRPGKLRALALLGGLEEVPALVRAQTEAEPEGPRDWRPLAGGGDTRRAASGRLP